MSKDKMDRKGANSRYHLRIEPEETGFHLRIGELWQYRYMIYLLTKKSFTVTYQQTLLGPLWILLQPTLSSLVYLFIFGYVADISTGGVPKILFYLLSSSFWELFAYSLSSNAGTFLSNAPLFSKVYFPRLAVPVSNMLVSILKFGIQLLLILAFLVFYVSRGRVNPEWAAFLFLPLLALQMSFLGMSVGILCSGFTTKYRDLMHIVGLIVNLWMYGSAVVYPLSVVPAGAVKLLIRINPLTQIMETVRLIILGTGTPDPALVVAGTLITVVLFIFSAALFNHVERTFVDTI